MERSRGVGGVGGFLGISYDGLGKLVVYLYLPIPTYTNTNINTNTYTRSKLPQYPSSSFQDNLIYPPALPYPTLPCPALPCLYK